MEDVGSATRFCENIPTWSALSILGDATNIFDASVKLLIQGSGAPFRQLQLGPVVQWMNVDLPRTQNRRVDLLGRMADGRLLHISRQFSVLSHQLNAASRPARN